LVTLLPTSLEHTWRLQLLLAFIGFEIFLLYFVSFVTSMRSSEHIWDWTLLLEVTAKRSERLGLLFSRYHDGHGHVPTNEETVYEGTKARQIEYFLIYGYLRGG
jgi:hypothetical protein